MVKGVQQGPVVVGTFFTPTVAKVKGLKIPLTRATEVVKEGVTYVP